MDHPIAAPGAVTEEMEFEEGDFEEFEVEKDEICEDEDMLDEDLEMEDVDEDGEGVLVDEDDQFVESAITWGSSMPDNSVSKIELGQEVMCIAIRPNGSMIAMGGQDDKVTITSPDDLSVVTVLDDMEETVNVLEWSNDGSSLAVGCLSGGDDVPGRVFLYNVDPVTQKLNHHITIDGPGDDVEWISWHPRGPCIMAGFADGTVWVWMTKTGNLYNVLVGHGGSVTCGKFIEDGKKAVTASADGGIIIWTLNTASVDFHLRPKPEFFGTYDIDYTGGHSNAIICISIHPKLPLIASGAEDNTVKIFNYETRRVVETLTGFGDTIESLTWFPHGSDHMILAAGSLDGSVVCWNGSLKWRPILSGRHNKPADVEGKDDDSKCGGVTRLKWLCSVTQADMGALDVLRRKAKLASISLDGTARIWSFQTDRDEQKVFGGSNGALVAVDSVEINDQEGIVFCGGDDGMVRGFKY